VEIAMRVSRDRCSRSARGEERFVRDASRKAVERQLIHRRRGTDWIPPVHFNRSRSVEGPRRISRARTFTACPDRHRLHTSSASAGDNAVRTISSPHPLARSEDHEVLR
jgi:hypothetical protein